LLGRASPVKVLGVALIAGAIGNLLVDGASTWQAAQQMPPRAWLLAAYLAVLCTAVGYTGWYLVIRETDVNIAALTIFVQPLAGVALAAGWLGETLHWGQLWGCLAIVGGLLIGLWTPQRASQNGLPAAVCPPEAIPEKGVPK
jgi:drug/metabolite transporter (DMT)-like permease